MALTDQQVREYEAALTRFIETWEGSGMLFDYSVQSLGALERLFEHLRRLNESASEHSTAAIARVASDAGVYVAEVFRRAHPEADASFVDEELVVTLPSRPFKNGRLKVRPVARVWEALQEDKDLRVWAMVSVAMVDPAYSPSTASRNPSGTPS